MDFHHLFKPLHFPPRYYFMISNLGRPLLKFLKVSLLAFFSENCLKMSLLASFSKTCCAKLIQNKILSALCESLENQFRTPGPGLYPLFNEVRNLGRGDGFMSRLCRPNIGMFRLSEVRYVLVFWTEFRYVPALCST